MRPALRVTLSFIPFALACQNERGNPHVYASPPPRPVAEPTAGASAATPALPAAALGANGPGATIASVLDAATGAPVELTSARGTVDVMTLVALGPKDWGSTRAQMDLAVRGTRDTTILFDLGSPAPLMAAHAFRVPLGDLGPGRYSVRVRLLRGAGQVVVESAPVFLVVP